VQRQNFLYLLYETTRCAFLEQEKNSLLGTLWHLLNPLAMSFVLYLVFSHVRQFAAMPHFGLYILVGVIHFNFFAHTTTHAAQGMLYSRNLVLNSTVPLEILVLRSVSLDGLTYLIELLIVLGLIAGVGQGLTWGVLGYGVTLVGIMMLTLGVSLLLACAVVFLTDLIYLWSVIVRLLFFLTPIFYAPDMLEHRLMTHLLAFNPLALLVMLGRKSLLDMQMVGPGDVIAALSGPVLILLVGWYTFQRAKGYIPDYI
jgi:ABC-type polysaccharide/polyol phosphate export permease